MAVVKEFEKIELIREGEAISIYVNGEKIETKNTLGIHLDIRYDDKDGAVFELTTKNRVCILTRNQNGKENP